MPLAMGKNNRLARLLMSHAIFLDALREHNLLPFELGGLKPVLRQRSLFRTAARSASCRSHQQHRGLRSSIGIEAGADDQPLAPVADERIPID